MLINKINLIINLMSKGKIICNLHKETKKLLILGKINPIKIKVINKKTIHQ
jgi:hypothetical protein